MLQDFSINAAAVLLCYCFAVEEEMVYAVTFWIVTDIEQASGRQILLNALKHMVRIFTVAPQNRSSSDSNRYIILLTTQVLR